jgi:hypothetical protein
MNEGKSQTWLYYGSLLAFDHGIEYIGKMDTDSLPYLDKYFEFADSSLPPAPYNTRILAGTIVDKRWWPEKSDEENNIKEAFFRKRYSSLHLYAAGQMYIMSRDLAQGVAEVCSSNATVTEAEGHEDHDVSTYAFMALKGSMDHPLKLFIIAMDNVFWTHKTKTRFGVRRWRKSWDDEISRLRRVISGESEVSSNYTDLKATANITYGTAIDLLASSESNVTYNTEDGDAIEPYNAHKNYSMYCSNDNNLTTFDVSTINPVTFPLFEMVHGYFDGAEFNYVGQAQYAGPMLNGVKLLTSEQTCLYSALDRWWDLADELKITRWAAIGETALSVTCHRSISPWDNLVEIIVNQCDLLRDLWVKGVSVTAIYPLIKENQYVSGPWRGRLLDENWILLKPSRESKLNGYKLKSVAESLAGFHEDVAGGLNIFCLDGAVNDDIKVIESSGYSYHLAGNWSIDTVDFGPTAIQILPQKVTYKYLLERFERPYYCDYPFDDTSATFEFTPNTIMPPVRASQLETTLSKWYIPLSTRKSWLGMVDKISGTNLTKKVPNLNEVEIDNSIADPLHCRVDTDGSDAPMKVISFNMNGGRYWSEFTRMIHQHWTLLKPDVIILNEVDIGMARSNNIHTARKLAFSLQMNYAWGLEFVELTNGNWDDQEQTINMENSLGLTGSAILSKCKIYDPLIIRDKLEDDYFSSKRTSRNNRGSQKRLGGRMALYVRIRNETSTVDNAKHMILGTVNQLRPKAHRGQIRKYLGFGTPIDGGVRSDTPLDGQVATVVSGAFDRKFCIESGLHNIDRAQKHNAWPVDCKSGSFGKTRSQYFCSNSPSAWEDEAYLPCYVPEDNPNMVPIQISNHAITQIRLH